VKKSRISGSVRATAPPRAEIAAMYRAANWSRPMEVMLDALRAKLGDQAV
jgi:hypothetical protein